MCLRKHPGHQCQLTLWGQNYKTNTFFCRAQAPTAPRTHTKNKEHNADILDDLSSCLKDGTFNNSEARWRLSVTDKMIYSEKTERIWL